MSPEDSPRYVLLGELGRGTGGLVLLAEDRHLGRRVAIKWAGPDAAQGARDRILHEHAVLSRCRHPHLVAALDLVDASELDVSRVPQEARAHGPALVLEHLAGPSVAEARLAQEQALEAWVQVAHAVEALHAHGFVHRDLKPSNVLLRATPGPQRVEAVVSDLGASGVVGAGLPAGTPDYLAPETLLGLPPRPAADVHGLGGLLFFLLTGHAPWSELPLAAALEARRHGSPTIPKDAGVGAPLRRVLAALLSPNPSARPPSPLAAVALLNRETKSRHPETLGALAPRPGLAAWVGRAGLLSRVDAWLREAGEMDAAGPARVVRIVGPPGSGRTRLLEEIDVRARLSGLRTFREAPSAPDAHGVILLDEEAAADAVAPSAATWFVVADAPLAHPGPSAEEVLVLEPLSDAECIALAAAVLGLPAGARGDGGALRAATGGIPALVEQQVASLAEAGAVDWRDGELVLLPVAGKSLADLVRLRAQRLTARAIALLELAAVLDRPATLGQLAVLVGEPGPDRIAAEVAELLSGGFLRVASQDERQGARMEAPSAVGDIVRETIPPTRLRTLHLAAASALARTAPESAAEQAEHLEAAGAPGRAAPLHLQAGRELLERSLPLPATRHLRRGLELSADEERAPWRVMLARAEALSGDAAAAVRTIAAALPELATESDRARALAFAAEAASHAGDPKTAEVACREARRLFRRVHSPLGRAECANRLGLLAAGRGDGRQARAAFRAAMTVARQRGDQGLEARVLNNLGSLARDDGELAQAALHHAAARDLRRQIGDVRGAAKATNNLGIVHGMAGRHAEAASAFAEAVAAFRECGDRREEARCLNNRGMVLWQADRLGEADDAFRQAEELFATLEDRRLRADCERNRALVALDRGRLDGARELLERALADKDAAGPAERAAVLVDLGDVMRHLGRLDDASSRHGEAAKLLEGGSDVASSGLARLSERLDRALAGHVQPPAPRPRDLAQWAPEDRLRWLLESAQLAEAAGDLEASRGHAREAIPLAQGRAGWDLLAARTLAAGTHPAGDDLHVLSEAVAHVKPGVHVEWAWRARLRLARGLAAGGRPLAAATQAELAREELAQLGDGLDERAREAFWAQDARRSAAKELEEILAAPARRNQDVLTPVLLDFVRLLNANLDAVHLLPRIVDFALELTGADRGCLILFEDSPDLVRVARTRKGEDLPRESFQHSRTIVDRVRATREPVVIASFDAEPVPRSESIHELKLASATCVPLHPPAGVEGGPLGAIYVDSLVGQSGFGEREVELLKALAVHATAALVNAQLLARIRAEKALLEDEVERLRGAGLPEGAFGEALGRSPPMRRVFALLERVAPSEASVLIEGESGTGKEVLARAIHGKSRRAAGPFVAVDCGSLPEALIESELFGHRRGAFTGADRDRPGLFEQASGGTIFLDEVAGTTAALQAKLLRVIQEREVRRIGDNAARPIDVRVVAASNRRLSDEVAAGRFREDLYYRLNVVSVSLPPLRDRPEDVPLLARSFLERAAQREGRDLKGWHPAALQLLARHGWPGNVRELANVVERAVVLAAGPLVTVADLPASMTSQGPGPREEPGEAAERPVAPTLAAPPRLDLWAAVVDRGESFWTVVRDAFVRHDITRDDIRSFVSQGLLRTGGSYRALAKLLSLEPDEYKRFMDFLRQNRCQVDFRPYRAAGRR